MPVDLLAESAQDVEGEAHDDQVHADIEDECAREFDLAENGEVPDPHVALEHRAAEEER